MNAFYGAIIGAVGTWVVAATIRCWNLPAEIRENDRQLADLDDDLALWVADEKARVDATLKRVPGEANRDVGTVSSGETTSRMACVKEQALHLYRDREHETRQKAAEIRGRERWRHIVVRRAHPRLAPFAELTSPARAKPILDAWRSDVEFQDLPQVPVDDPTARTLDKALTELCSLCTSG